MRGWCSWLSSLFGVSVSVSSRLPFTDELSSTLLHGTLDRTLQVYCREWQRSPIALLSFCLGRLSQLAMSTWCARGRVVSDSNIAHANVVLLGAVMTCCRRDHDSHLHCTPQSAIWNQRGKGARMGTGVLLFSFFDS